MRGFYHGNGAFPNIFEVPADARAKRGKCVDRRSPALVPASRRLSHTSARDLWIQEDEFLLAVDLGNKATSFGESGDEFIVGQ
jgi:hypothetical protein